MEKNKFLALLDGQINSKMLHHANIIICKNEEEIDLMINDISNIFKIKYDYKFDFPEVFINNESTITKDEILKLIDEFSYLSSEINPRIFMIRRIDLMSEHASNSFLKFLEEPSNNTYGFMFAINDVNILETIKSRSKITDIFSIRNQEFYFLHKLNIENVLVFSKELTTNKKSEIISDFELYYIKFHKNFNKQNSEEYLSWLNNLSIASNISIPIENLLIIIWEVMNERSK